MPKLSSFLPVLVCLILSFSGCGEKKAETQNLPPEKQVVDQPSPSSSHTAKGEDRVTFIELGSLKCIPCKMMQPVMAEIKKEYEGRVEVLFYDVFSGEGRAYAQKYRIRIIPTQVFLTKNGEEFFRHEGFFPKEQIEEVLQQQGVKK